MLLRDYIEALEVIEAEHGNLPVKSWLGWDIRDASVPKVRFTKILTGRQFKQRLWHVTDGETAKGAKVVES